MSRVGLNKKHLASAAGNALLQLLMEITKDGVLSDDEVHRLRAWLESNKEADLPALRYLREVVDQVLVDGRITLADRWDLLLAVEKCVPPEERALVKMRRRDSPSPATTKQLEYLRILQIPARDDLTMVQAGELIDQFKNREHLKAEPRVRSSGGGRRKRSQKLDGWGCLLLLILIGWAYSQCQGTP